MNEDKNTETTKFMLYLPLALLEKIREEARKNYRSVNGQLRYILDEYFAKVK